MISLKRAVVAGSIKACQFALPALLISTDSAVPRVATQKEREAVQVGSGTVQSWKPPAVTHSGREFLDKKRRGPLQGSHRSGHTSRISASSPKPNPLRLGHAGNGSKRNLITFECRMPASGERIRQFSESLSDAPNPGLRRNSADSRCTQGGCYDCGAPKRPISVKDNRMDCKRSTRSRPRCRGECSADDSKTRGEGGQNFHPGATGDVHFCEQDFGQKGLHIPLLPFWTIQTSKKAKCARKRWPLAANRREGKTHL